jgi:hypothetical protein
MRRACLHRGCVCVAGAQVTIFFYNPNIHPRKEYEIRKEENKRYALRHGVPFVDCDYDQRTWFERMKGLEYDPERGVRCTACFDMRMEVAVAYAAAHGFPAFTTTNATSRWKDVKQVNDAGQRAAARYAATAAAAGGAGAADGDGGGGSAAAAVRAFLRVHWVAVPKGLRARRVNRRWRWCPATGCTTGRRTR